MTSTGIAAAAGSMSALGVILAAVLALADRKSYVYEDPRIDDVEDMLPHADCGPCGKPGSRPFAEVLDTALSRVAGSREAWTRRNQEIYRDGRWAEHLYDEDIVYPALVRVKDG